MLIAGLVSYLNSQPAITSVVNGRIGPIPAPANLSEYPCIVYQLASYVPEYDNDGPSGVTKARVVFDCFGVGATGYSDASNLAASVCTALSGFGVVAGQPGSGVLPDGTQVYLTEVVNMADGYVDDARTMYRTSVHLLIQFAN